MLSETKNAAEEKAEYRKKTIHRKTEPSAETVPSYEKYIIPYGKWRAGTVAFVSSG